MTTPPEAQYLLPVVRRLMETGVPPDLGGCAPCVHAFLHEGAVLVSEDRGGQRPSWIILAPGTAVKVALEVVRIA